MSEQDENHQEIPPIEVNNPREEKVERPIKLFIYVANVRGVLYHRDPFERVLEEQRRRIKVAGLSFFKAMMHLWTFVILVFVIFCFLSIIFENQK